MRKTSILPNSGAETTDYPFGYIIDEDNTTTGTPVMEATYSDFIQNLWHFFTKTGITPNGGKDNVTNGFQLFRAMEQYFEPIGTIKLWAGAASAVPGGWAICDGSAIGSSTDYADLYAVIGTTYGGTASAFKLPSLSGKVPVGLNTANTYFKIVGQTGGEETHVLQLLELPEHAHNVKIPTKSGVGEVPSSPSFVSNEYTPGRTAINLAVTSEKTGGSNAHNNLQPYITLIYIIKIKYGAGI